MLDGTLNVVSLFLYGAIALLAAGFWMWVVGSHVYGWDSPMEVVEKSEK